MEFAWELGHDKISQLGDTCTKHLRKNLEGTELGI